MIYAPILIPTLCRAEHFIKCVESLKRNRWAKYTDVYIALDYPSKDSHWDGYQKICYYLEHSDFGCFNGFYVEKREKNLGPGMNMKTLREQVLQKYDRFIRTDDDVVFSPNFIEYMDKALYEFEDNNNVCAVTGYSYPIDWDVDEDSNTMLGNYAASTWGIGFWRSKFIEMHGYITSGGLINEFGRAVKEKINHKMIDAAWNDYVRGVTCLHPEKSLICATSDISMRIYLAMNDKYVALPRISKARNLGFDGSGVYCPNIDESISGEYADNYNYSSQPIDEDSSFDIILDKKNHLSINRKKLNAFDRRKKGVMLEDKLREYVYIILGPKHYSAVAKLLKGYFNK